MQIVGQGHCLGSKIEDNVQVARNLGLDDNWFLDTTGIRNRVVCAENENVTSLSVRAVQNALETAGQDIADIQDRTLLLHIQNGITHLTPPTAIILASELNCQKLRSLSFDGVCSEPINVIEIADLMMKGGGYEYIIVSAGVDFLQIVNPVDRDTVGLFGAGAGAIVFKRSAKNYSAVKGVHWENRPEHWDLGLVELRGVSRHDTHVSLDFGYYEMHGQKLAKVALKMIPYVIGQALKKADWKMDEVDLFISHQPNAKLLEIGIRQMQLTKDDVFCPVSEVGNLGPASILSSFSMAIDAGRITKGSKLVFISFGLGFSCGAACIEY